MHTMNNSNTHFAAEPNGSITVALYYELSPVHRTLRLLIEHPCSALTLTHKLDDSKSLVWNLHMPPIHPKVSRLLSIHSRSGELRRHSSLEQPDSA
jgi:hypothetical protein